MENIEQFVFVSYIVILIIGIIIIYNIVSKFDQMTKNYIRLYELIEDVKHEMSYDYDINRDRLLKLTENIENYHRDFCNLHSTTSHLCDHCQYSIPSCPAEKQDVVFGNGFGNDNICCCNRYKPFRLERK